MKTMKQINNLKWQNRQTDTITTLSLLTIMFNKSLCFIFTYYGFQEKNCYLRDTRITAINEMKVG